MLQPNPVWVLRLIMAYPPAAYPSTLPVSSFYPHPAPSCGPWSRHDWSVHTSDSPHWRRSANASGWSQSTGRRARVVPARAATHWVAQTSHTSASASARLHCACSTSVRQSGDTASIQKFNRVFNCTFICLNIFYNSVKCIRDSAWLHKIFLV